MTIQRHQHGRQILLHNTALLPEIPERFFELGFWQEDRLVTGQATGRGITWFLRYQGLQLVWRRYRRGGLIGKIIKQHFFKIGSTRAEQEFFLLQKLQSLALPAPAPVAARIENGLFFYQAEIMVQRIPDAEDIATLLQHRALNDKQWRAIGGLIARFHQHHVFHSDLNCHNILLDQQQQLWLIDFDKCDIRQDGTWKAGNLARLKRSLDKESKLHSGFHFQEQNWQQLLTGYSTD